jgi:glycerol-3-phosphate acyltransferase PlsX
VGLVKIALDAMGGDRAPEVIIEGALAAQREIGAAARIVLVGREDEIHGGIARLGGASAGLEVVDARDVVSMGEQPSATLRKKKDSSIAVGLRLQAEGKVQGFISAGNTGAVAANALIILGRIKGVDRPAIATYVPTRKGGCILLDVGASIDPKPSHLVQYAVMGSCYAGSVLGKTNPRVGLLNIGEESSKGTDVMQEAHVLLQSSGLNFVGNVEGRDIFAGSVDVTVCDGFVGNIVLKFAESIVDMVYGVIKQTVTADLRAKTGALLLRPAFQRLKEAFDYEEYGGAPLLGVDGVCMICHGSSSARAIKNAVLAARRVIDYDITTAIKERLNARDQGHTRSA